MENNLTCKIHLKLADFICSCSEAICNNCIDNHKNHKDFTLRSLNDIQCLYNKEIKEINTILQILNSPSIEITNLTNQLTKEFFKQFLVLSTEEEKIKTIVTHQYDYVTQIKEIKEEEMSRFLSKNYKDKLLILKRDKLYKIKSSFTIRKDDFIIDYLNLLRKYFNNDHEEEVKINVHEQRNDFTNNNCGIKIKHNDSNIINREMSNSYYQNNTFLNSGEKIVQSDLTMKEEYILNKYDYDEILDKSIKSMSNMFSHLYVSSEEINQENIIKNILKEKNQNEKRNGFRNEENFSNNKKEVLVKIMRNNPQNNRFENNNYYKQNKENNFFDLENSNNSNKINLTCLECKKNYYVEKGEEYKKRCLDCYLKLIGKK